MLMIVSTYCSQAVYNNIKDIEGDKLNSPERPLASGRLSIGFAWALMLLLILMGFVFAYMAAPFLVLVNLAYVILGIAYSKYTKSVWILSYSTLVTTHIIIPVVSGYLLSRSLDVKIMAIVGFLYLTEVLAFSLKDYKDIDGDRRMNMDTLPIAYDRNLAARITAAGLILPLLVFWIPWKIFQLSAYFIILYLCAGLMRYTFATKLIRNPSPAAAGHILNNFRYVLLVEMGAWCLS